jgi:hypothetical protein
LEHAACAQLLLIDGQFEKFAHEFVGFAKVFNGFKKRHDIEVALQFIMVSVANQSSFFGKEHHFQNVADFRSHADDVSIDGTATDGLKGAANLAKSAYHFVGFFGKIELVGH